MDPSRPTRKKAANQASSFQLSKTAKDKQNHQENILNLNDKLSPKQTSNDKNLSESLHGTELESCTNKNSNSETAQLENHNEDSKRTENVEKMAIEEQINLVTAKSKDILYGDDASEETKRQIESLFETAQSFASKEDYKQAINIYNRIVRLNSKSTAAWIALGHCFAMLDANYEALQSYQHAISITPDSQKDDQLWYGIGLLYQKVTLEIEDWKNAETSFRNALKLNPNPGLKGEILYHLGVIMKVRGDNQEGIKMLTNSILLGFFSVERMIDILCNIGTALEELNEMNEAMQTYKYALILDENNYRAMQCIGWLCFQLDKINEALEHLNKASLLNDNEANTQYMKARCYLKLSQHNKAYECLHKCINKDSSNSTYWCSLGILFAELTQFKSAHECLSNALKFNSKSAENYFNLGCLFELCSQWNDATQMYDKALELQPNLQLAQNRKQGIHGQIDDKNASLEVQFKHHKFILSFIKDIDKEKPLFFFPQATQFTSSNMLSRSKANFATSLQNTENTNTSTGTSNIVTEQILSLTNETNHQQSPTVSSASIPIFHPIIPQISGGVPANMAVSQANTKQGITPILTQHSPQTEQISSFTPKQLVSGTGIIMPPSSQQQNSILSNRNTLNVMKQNASNSGNLGVLSLLSIQKNSSNPTNNQIINEHGKIEEAKININDTRIGEKKSNAGFLATSRIEGQSEASTNSFKLNKNLTQPILLKLDPQLISKKDEDQKEKLQDNTKPQNTGFKLTPKANRGEEGLIPQKKIKLDKNDNNGVESVTVDKKQGNKKTQSLVLRPSPLNN